MKINVETIKASLRQPALYYIPKQISIINGRRLKGRALKIDGLTLPDKGTFAKVFTALQHNIDVTINDQNIIVTENATSLNFSEAHIDVYWLLIHSETYSAISSSGPIYHTILHILENPYDFYVQIPAARAATYLVHHPHSLSINNLTHVGRFQDDKNEYELCDEINRFGYVSRGTLFRHPFVTLFRPETTLFRRTNVTFLIFNLVIRQIIPSVGLEY